MHMEEHSVYFIALVCVFFSKQQNRCPCERRKQPGKEVDPEGGVKGHVARPSRLPSGPAAAWNVKHREDARAAAEHPQRPKPSSANGLGLSGAFPLLLSSQSRYISPGSRTWGLVRDTARLEETQRRMIRLWEEAASSPLWCQNSNQNIVCLLSLSLVIPFRCLSVGASGSYMGRTSTKSTSEPNGRSNYFKLRRCEWSIKLASLLLDLSWSSSSSLLLLQISI